MRTRVCAPLIIGTLAGAVALAGCQHPSSGTAIAPATKATAHIQVDHPTAPIKAPDFGGVTTKHVEVTASGPTMEAAVNNAIELAVQQVDGVRVAAQAAKVSLTTTLQANGQQATASATAYANLVATATNGAVTNFQMLSQQQVRTPVSTDQVHLGAKHGASWSQGGAQQGAASVDYSNQHTEYTTSWQVRIGADVAVYRESAAAKRTTVVVAEPVVSTQTYDVGDSQVPATTIADAIQTEISNALTETHRFTVLDRNADPEINAEVQRIEAGNDVASATARIGQQLSADLIVIPTIDHFTYARHERRLQLAQRTLAWYSGDAEVSFRVVNATTSQIVMAKAFHYAFPSTSPTTLDVSVNGTQLTQQMMGAIGHDIIGSILRSTYPVLVVMAQGQTVVLNQGGDVVSPGTAYHAVFLGKSVVDPESGQSLGPIETPCCTIVVDRVTPKLAYGHIVGDTPTLLSPFKPGTIELTGIAELPASAQPPTLAAQTTHVRRQSPRKPAKSAMPASSDSNW